MDNETVQQGYMDNNCDNIEINDDDDDSSSDDYRVGDDSSDDDAYDAILDIIAYSLGHVVDYFLERINNEQYMAAYIIREKWMNKLFYGHDR